MMNMSSEGGDKCPFDLNFEPDTFKVGDLVSYRVDGGMMDMPFVGVLVEVHDDHVMIAHYDGNPSYSDFEAFGGWSKPSIKQYLGDKTSCGAGIDYNYYP